MKKSTPYVVLQATLEEVAKLRKLMPMASLTWIKDDGYKLSYEDSLESHVIKTLISQEMLSSIKEAQKAFGKKTFKALLDQDKAILDAFIRLETLIGYSDASEQIRTKLLNHRATRMITQLSGLFKMSEEHLKYSDALPYWADLTLDDFDQLYQEGFLKPTHHNS